MSEGDVLPPRSASNYLIVDALDECSDMSGMPSPREQALGLLKELVELSLPNLHICVTSRPEVDIRKLLSSRHVSLHDQGRQKKDIVDYVTSVVHSDPNMGRWREEDRELVSTRSLRELMEGVLPTGALRHMLEELPETLDETYERMLRNIHKAKRDHGRRLLQCLTVAVRPLRVTELVEVLVIDFGTASGAGPVKVRRS